MRTFLACSLLIAELAAAIPASAQQPLDDFLHAADTANLDLRGARAAVSQARSQVDEARARLLPAATALGTYTRNENEVSISIPDPETGMTRENVFTPYDQLDARFTLTAPILDLGAWATFLATEAVADSVDLSSENAQREVHVAVATLWHQVVAFRLLVGAANRSVEVAEGNRTDAAARVEVGASPQLELARAEAEVQRTRQALAEAQLSATLTARSLHDATGLEPASEPAMELDDDLHAEAPLDRYRAEVEHHPTILAADADVVAAERLEHAAWFSLAPTISAQVTERITNAAGFGPNNVWAAGVTATWQLDFVRPAIIGTRSAAAEAARIRAEQARQSVETQIFTAWHQVETLRIRAQAAAAQLDASRRAADDAQARFEAGAGTQYEVIQAQRDLFTAEALQIQAVAELRVARFALRIRSGVQP